MRTTDLNNGKKIKTAALSIMLLAVSTISFSQMGNIKDFWRNNLKEKFFQTEELNSSFMTVAHFEEAEWLESPVIAKSILVNSVDISYEESLEVEDWMTTPFDALIEEDIEVEDWMNDPFAAGLESNIEVEEWMTSPMAWNN
jgi:hypothetical protein